MDRISTSRRGQLSTAGVHMSKLEDTTRPVLLHEQAGVIPGASGRQEPGGQVAGSGIGAESGIPGPGCEGKRVFFSIRCRKCNHEILRECAFTNTIRLCRFWRWSSCVLDFQKPIVTHGLGAVRKWFKECGFYIPSSVRCRCDRRQCTSFACSRHVQLQVTDPTTGEITRYQGERL